MQAHVIENGVVVNTIMVNTLADLPGLDLIDGSVGGIGWLVVDGAVVPPPVPPPSLDGLKVEKLAEINAAFDQAAQALTAGYPEAERLTWDTQRAEALAWQVDPLAPTPYLDGLAAARGITAEDMRQKTLDQTLLFLQASQLLVGKRQRLRDAIDAATDEAEVLAINWEEV